VALDGGFPISITHVKTARMALMKKYAEIHFATGQHVQNDWVPSRFRIGKRAGSTHRFVKLNIIG
jgi:hypothetical protein